ncbi:NAD(P)-binding domain-containing protein [Helicobacter sp. MIT 14-3879]|uniref:NAD(P)-binding domain-containing protein n=1 Tax=Helicobacter sp. MIT 14-3879 TaxID=2040649 RepID=UPI000E1FB15A|nr:NAD(P)-binding domain-containing protein [Helicobacter sp. MIT 14-3879]RDU59774.1 cbb3-type cytochrome oxidase assembly protein CcoS [Helicobacter sp. MIT 14-3879]
MKHYEVVIIGSGPGGIASAIECKKFGIENILLLEKTDKISAMIREYYKDGKRVDKDYKGQVVDLKGHIAFSDGNKESTLYLFTKLLEENNVEMICNSEVEQVSKTDKGFVIKSGIKSFSADFVIIGIGKMGKPNKPHYPIPVSLRKKANFNINECQAGEEILVVGGGNSAVEYAVYLASITKTTLNYRRSKFTRINDENAKELEKSLQQGLIGKFGIDIQSLEDDNGRFKVNFTDHSSEHFDRIIYAIGGVVPLDFLKKCGIEVDSHGIASHDEKSKESNISNLFVVGDILYKNGGSIAKSMNDAYDIVEKIYSLRQKQ